jgi:hypothetical protein
MRLTGATLGRIHAATHLFGSINCYHGLFANKLYIGTLEYASLVIENYCDPIIDRPTWDAVQAIQSRFTGRRHVSTASLVHPRRLAGSYLLSGIVFCLRCGAPLVGHPSTIKSGRTYASYRCTNAKNRRDCTARLIPAAPLETEILRHIQDYVLRPEVLSVMLEETLAAARTASLSLRPRQAGLRRKLSALDKQVRNLARAIAAAGPSPALLAELTTLERETSQADQPAPTTEQIAAVCAFTAEKLQQGDIHIRRRILQSLINKIAVDRDEHGIHGILTLYALTLSPSPILSIANAPGGSMDYSHTFHLPLPLRHRP